MKYEKMLHELIEKRKKIGNMERRFEILYKEKVKKLFVKTYQLSVEIFESTAFKEGGTTLLKDLGKLVYKRVDFCNNKVSITMKWKDYEEWHGWYDELIDKKFSLSIENIKNEFELIGYKLNSVTLNSRYGKPWTDHVYDTYFDLDPAYTSEDQKNGYIFPDIAKAVYEIFVEEVNDYSRSFIYPRITQSRYSQGFHVFIKSEAFQILKN